YDTVAPTNFGLHGFYTAVVGDVGNIDNIKSPLWVTDGVGPSKVILDGLFSPGARTVTVNNDTITGLAPVPIKVQGYTTMQINTSMANDTINVPVFFGQLNILTAGGSDKVNFGKNGNISSINGTMKVYNQFGSGTQLTIDDSASNMARQVDVVGANV